MKKTLRQYSIRLLGLLLITMMILPACTSAPATPTPTPAPTLTSTPTPSLTLTPTTSPIPSPTPTPTLTPTPTPTPSPTPTTTTSTPTTTPTPTSTGATFQTLANAGQPTYSSTCAVCHGADGGGTDICPVVIWGSGSTLGTYNGVTLFTDAQGMLNYMSKSMPMTAPGSLTSQQYIDLLAFILTQGNIVSPSTVFNQSQLSSITIK